MKEAFKHMVMILTVMEKKHNWRLSEMKFFFWLVNVNTIIQIEVKYVTYCISLEIRGKWQARVIYLIISKFKDYIYKAINLSLMRSPMNKYRWIWSQNLGAEINKKKKDDLEWAPCNGKFASWKSIKKILE